MIAMQYSFALPADYDMSVIDRRVAEKGHLLDDHEPLLLKSYNVARRGDGPTGSRENLYAPFYVWKDTQGMNDFLCGPGFKGLVQAFGWPAVRTWPVMLANHRAQIVRARFATRQVVQMSPFTALDELRATEEKAARAAMEEGALCAVSAFEPTGWTLVRFRAWREERPCVTCSTAGTIQAYEVQHVSNPAGL